MPMSTYTLTATLGSTHKRVRLDCEDDSDATMSAIVQVMDRGSKSTIWARGRIELRDARGGLIHEMDAKGDDE